ncbi:MAG: molybdate ABC transporter substrate-binding protein [Actinomycetota bacterium]|nr:molybdate ABC transporter substrate-binding protein [Actinomycetota bacterium]
MAIGGCGGDEEGGERGELTVSAASSLSDAFEDYGETTNGDEKFSFAGSDDLATQIRKGAPVDVFAAANTSLPDALFDEGLVEAPEVFISNQLVLAVPTGSDIVGIGGLVRSDADLVIGAEGVPAGDYTREVLGKLPDDAADAILAQVRSEEPDVKGIVGKLVAGAADAGFVYASDVDAAGDELTAIELPPSLDPVVTYAAAVVSDAENPEAAQAFVDGLLEGAGRDALLDAGFLEPRGE